MSPIQLMETHTEQQIELVSLILHLKSKLFELKREKKKSDTGDIYTPPKQDFTSTDFHIDANGRVVFADGPRKHSKFKNMTGQQYMEYVDEKGKGAV